MTAPSLSLFQSLSCQTIWNRFPGDMFPSVFLRLQSLPSPSMRLLWKCQFLGDYCSSSLRTKERTQVPLWNTFIDSHKKNKGVSEMLPYWDCLVSSEIRTVKSFTAAGTMCDVLPLMFLWPVLTRYSVTIFKILNEAGHGSMCLKS